MPDPEPPSIDVLGLGCVAVDDFLYVPAYPAPDTKVQVRQHVRQCGGLTATALVAAARFGARCAFAGVLGDDEDSRFVQETFQREGIDLGPMILRPEARPIRSTIVVDDSQQTRTILYDLAGSTGADPSLPPEAVIRSARVLFVDHYGIEGMTRAARIARQAGIPVVADLERSDWPGFADLLALVDHLVVSHAFAHTWTGSSDPAEAVARLWSESRAVVLVTAGEKGCWYQATDRPGTVFHHPAFAVEAADTTGCGDVFHGVYAATLAQGLDLEERLRLSSAAAAIKAMRTGGQVGIPRRPEVEAFLLRQGPSEPEA
jgi:sulfofructose kinase